MRRYDPWHRMLAVGLAGLAGFVDALGFRSLNGLFMSFMSGNSTRMAVGLTTNMPYGALPLFLIVAFVGGVMIGETVGRRAGRWHRPAVLGVVLAGLIAAAATAEREAGTIVATLLMAASMGSANATFQRNGEVSIGVTYMTGTLVKIGQHLVAAIAGGPRFAWAPYVMLWLGFIGGAVAGSAAFTSMGLEALWIAGWGASLLLIVATTLGPSQMR